MTQTETNLENNLEAWTQLKSALAEQMQAACAESPSQYECKDSAAMFFILRKEKSGEQPLAVSLVYDLAANTLKIGYSWQKKSLKSSSFTNPTYKPLKNESSPTSSPQALNAARRQLQNSFLSKAHADGA